MTRQDQADQYEEDFIADEEMTDEYKLAPLPQVMGRGSS